MVRNVAKVIAGAVVFAVLVSGGRYARAESQKELTVMGRVTPTEWHDALGIYSQRWNVTVIVCEGDKVCERWTGLASSGGVFKAPIHRDMERTAERVEVRVNGDFLYGDQKVEVATTELDPAVDAVDVGTIIMQRQR